MRAIIFLFAFCLTAVVGEQRIAGGSFASIQSYPYAVAALRSSNHANYILACGGVILNNRSVLSAAHCFFGTAINGWAVRVGSSYASSGGFLHHVANLISHPQFQYFYRVNDIGIFRISGSFNFGVNVQPGSFAGANYVVADNQTVSTYGWGISVNGGPLSEQLQHVQIRTVNQDVCRRNYNIISMAVSNMTMCAGNIEQGGQGPCNGDFGGPLLHNGNVIGIASYDSAACAFRDYPAIFTRVPLYITWIRNNA